MAIPASSALINESGALRVKDAPPVCENDAVVVTVAFTESIAISVTV